MSLTLKDISQIAASHEKKSFKLKCFEENAFPLHVAKHTKESLQKS